MPPSNQEVADDGQPIRFLLLLSQLALCGQWGGRDSEGKCNYVTRLLEISIRFYQSDILDVSIRV